MTKRYIVCIPLIAFCLSPAIAFAQDTSATSSTYTEHASVVTMLSDVAQGPAGQIPQNYIETVQARITSGPEQGKLIEFQQYYVEGSGQQLNPGDAIYVTRFLDQSDPSLSVYQYQELDHNRIPAVIFFVALFVLCIVLLGGKQGIRGLISLSAGICFIAFIFLPGVLHGYSPVALGILVASVFAGAGAYITHGFSRMTSSAVLGMVLSICIAALLAQAAVHFAYLSGVADETTADLLDDGAAFASINFQGLLFGGIIIGLSGVLYDAAIGQAVAVEELARAGSNRSRSYIYRRALRIGREHIGALVNTLVLAYVGTQLPMLLSIYSVGWGTASAPPVFNWEFLATEIIRTTVGATGLILTIPITTLVAVWMLVPRAAPARSATE